MKIIDIKINKVNTSSMVIACATVSFEDCLVKGFKIFRDEEKKKEYVTAPSYFGGKGWIPLFKTRTKEDWAELCSQVIDKYNEELIKESLLEDK